MPPLSQAHFLSPFTLKIVMSNVEDINSQCLYNYSYVNTSYADDTTLMAESEEELKSLLMKVKRRVKKLA